MQNRGRRDQQSFFAKALYNIARKKAFFMFLLICVFCVGVGGAFFFNRAQGVDFAFTQTDWRGGDSVNIANHTDDQTGWDEYASKDEHVTLRNEGTEIQTSSQSAVAHIDYENAGDYIQQDAINGTVIQDGDVSLKNTGGVSWTQRTIPSPASNVWEAITYGNGTFVAVTDAGIAATSSDGINWLQRVLPMSARSVTYGNGTFVAISASAAATSSDGITWTLRTLPTSNAWQEVAYGNGTFVAIAANTTIGATSPDGITWTQRTLPASRNWDSLAYGNGLFVSLSYNSSFAITSPDGITWIQRSLPVSTYWMSVTYGNGTFVAVSQSNAALTSPDGITWTQRTLPLNTSWYSVAYGNGTFVAIAYASSTAATSPDGITWTQRGLSSNQAWKAMTFGNNLFVAVPIGRVATTSPDGITWTQRTLPTNNYWKSVAYGNGTFVAVSSSSDVVATSPDGVTWTNRSLPLYTQWQTVTYGNGTFVILVSNSTIAATSPDGITWTQRVLPISKYWTSVTYGNGMFVGVATSNSAVAISSPNGITWTQRSLPASRSWASVTYGNGTFVAIAESSNKSATSPDGITWTERTMPSSIAWKSVTYGNGLFVAIARSSNKIATSPDGITWTERTVPLSSNWYSITYGNGTFVVVSAYSNVAITSSDGITWTQRTLPASINWFEVTYGNGLFVAVADSSGIVATASDSSYPTNSYYITTAAGSQKNTATWEELSSVTIDQITPADTGNKYLVSFDGRSTWKYWSGTQWQESAINDIAVNGMTKENVEGLTQMQWSEIGGFTPGTFDVAVSLSTTNDTVTPVVNDIAINYVTTNVGTYTLTSSPYNTQRTDAAIFQLSWQEILEPNTDIQFQIRTAQDLASLTNAAWCGPDDGINGSCNSATYFTQNIGGEIIDDTQRDELNNQYIQYKVFLSSTNAQNTPALSEVSVSYAATDIPQATTQAATDIVSDQAIGNATVIYTGDEDPERFIQYTTVENDYTNAQECDANIGGVGQYSCTLTSLNPSTVYYYRAKVTNSVGTSYGPEVSFTTLAPSIVIPDPDTAKIEDAVTDGYLTIENGTIENTTEVQTVVNVTFQTNGADILFPQNTQITESSSGDFNFQNFTTTNITNIVRQDQPTSRVAIDLGIPGESLNFSNDVTLTVFVGQAFNGQTLDILYQNDGESDWHTHSTPTCTVTNGQCTFQTNHATIYTINGVHQATGDLPLNINVEVQETLSMDCFDISDSNTTVQIGTTTDPGKVTAGTPAVGQSRCTVTTNADQGYYLTLVNDNTTTHPTLTHTDPNTATVYEIPELTTIWNASTMNTENWTASTTKGLGFSVIAFPQADTSHNTFNGIWNTTHQCPEGTNPDTNDYAGIPETPQTITAVTAYQETATTTDICYKVDVLPSQPSGQYTGSVTFTATSDASGYYQ